jgi:hemoglobin-like flavoprotein
VLLATLRDTAGEAWTGEYEQAWTRAYTFAAEVMQQAAAEVPATQATP